MALRVLFTEKQVTLFKLREIGLSSAGLEGAVQRATSGIVQIGTLYTF
jgi:hypothetical protein